MEALNSKIPLITTKGGCFSESGGLHSKYINPENIDEIAETINTISENNGLRQKMIVEGLKFAQQFKEDKIAENLMNTYNKQT